MSHLKTTTKRAIFAATLLSSAALCSVGGANAQVSATSQINYATPLSQFTSNDKTTQLAVLDWRKSSLDFTFDLPEANLTDNIELLLSANPQGVNPLAPLTVQFNNEEPVPLEVYGQGFDARFTLDPLKARSKRNIVRIRYTAAIGTDCIEEQDGAWDIDLAASKLVINSRAKRRGLQFSDLKEYFANPSLAPRRVGLIASGANATQLQALAAQGMGLHLDELPDFTTDRNSGDFEIIMARRSELFQYISDDTVIAGNGAAIFIPKGRPVKLVFTGNTDAQILTAPHKTELVRISDTQAFSKLPSATSFSNWRSNDWARGSKSLRFDVTDPNAMTGEVLLRLASSHNISDTSKFSLRLNGESLGTTILDKRRKSVAFRIKAGDLRGKDNVLTLMPELKPAETPSCTTSTGPNFHLGGGSKIILKTDTPSPVTELSRMTATAMPFSDERGAQSYIALTGDNADFNASLKVLARLAKTSGEGLITADYSRSVNLDNANSKHILFIGPSNRIPSALIQTAPRALTDALRGQVFEGDNLISASIEKFASLEANSSFKTVSQGLSQSRRISQGGVAALYPSQISDRHVVGIITNTPGQSFTSSVNRLIETPYWSEIKGGVARWSDGSVLTAQAPQIVPGYKFPKTNLTSQGLSFRFDSSIFDGLYNKTTNLTERLWSELKSFTAGLSGNKKTESPVSSAPDVKAPKTDQDWAKVAERKLRSANAWAKVQNSLRPMGQKIRDFFQPNSAANASQSFVQKLLSPAPLLLIIAFLLVLLGLVFSNTASRKDGN